VSATTIPTDTALAEAFVAAAIEAGQAILTVRRKGYRAERKADATPVTEADRAAEQAITAHLRRLAPDVPVVAEEACSLGAVPTVVGGRFFLVDPLDGTKEFVKGGGDFTVNIALIRDRMPAVGVVLAPAIGLVYVGVAGRGAWRGSLAGDAVEARQPIHVRTAGEALDVVASKSHRTPETDAFCGRYKVRKLVAAGSSLKFCTVAEGNADLYPRMGTTMQWDTAAGDAVLRAAGGRTLTLDGSPLPYGPEGTGIKAYENPWFVASGELGALSAAAPPRP
jgi:3'(2'),5'-bisphosphate nucleotidase